MDIYGLEKLSLVDYEGMMCATVFTGGCNFNCPFCHNASLVIPGSHGELLTEGDFFSFLDKRSGILEGVVVSGGEPLLQKDAYHFLSRIKSMGYSVKLDTNGTFPDVLSNIISDKLVDYVAVDIKNSPQKYIATTGVDVLSRVQATVEILRNSNIEYEFRTTAVKQLHTEKDFREIADWISNSSKYYIQCFSDSGDILGGKGYSAPNDETLALFLRAVLPKIPTAELRGV